MGTESSWVAGEVHTRISVFVKQANLGWALPDGTSYQCFTDDPQGVRRPDTSFIARGRLANETLPRGHCRIAPDLAVEVVSPRDTYYEVIEKVEKFLGAGVKLVWVLNRKLRIERPNGPTAMLHENDHVSGEDVLPGFSCRVGAFFPPRSPGGA
jgi:Uma2 family endonuclease